VQSPARIWPLPLGIGASYGLAADTDTSLVQELSMLFDFGLPTNGLYIRRGPGAMLGPRLRQRSIAALTERLPTR
jgi:hypothetical protein